MSKYQNWQDDEEGQDYDNDEEDECITGNHFFAFGSEDCEFCLIGETCKGLTLQHESFSGLSAGRGKP